MPENTRDDYLPRIEAKIDSLFNQLSDMRANMVTREELRTGYVPLPSADAHLSNISERFTRIEKSIDDMVERRQNAPMQLREWLVLVVAATSMIVTFAAVFILHH